MFRLIRSGCPGLIRFILVSRVAYSILSRLLIRRLRGICYFFVQGAILCNSLPSSVRRDGERQVWGGLRRSVCQVCVSLGVRVMFRDPLPYHHKLHCAIHAAEETTTIPPFKVAENPCTEMEPGTFGLEEQ
jgi:hypothetical protein